MQLIIIIINKIVIIMLLTMISIVISPGLAVAALQRASLTYTNTCRVASYIRNVCVCV